MKTQAKQALDKYGDQHLEVHGEMKKNQEQREFSFS